MGSRICVAARAFGLLTRPIRDTIVLMPPFCMSETDLEEMVGAVGEAIRLCAGEKIRAMQEHVPSATTGNG
jgi:adenosylmethionine-8-amino-7-oxononanoate aminotransferase